MFDPAKKKKNEKRNESTRSIKRDLECGKKRINTSPCAMIRISRGNDFIQGRCQGFRVQGGSKKQVAITRKNAREGRNNSENKMSEFLWVLLRLDGMFFSWISTL